MFRAPVSPSDYKMYLGRGTNCSKTKKTLVQTSLLYYGAHIHMFLLVNIFGILTGHKMECRCGNQYIDFTDTYLPYTP